MGRVLSELRIDDPRDVVGMTRKKGGGRESDTSGEASPTRVASPPRESQDAPRPQTPARRWDYHGAGLAQADDSGGNRDTPPDEAAADPAASEHWCMYRERIRELQAELVDYRTKADRRYNWMRDRQAEDAVRAERAEALVKVLESLLRKDLGPGGFWDREREELRGEDRG